MASNQNISMAVIRRLPKYHRYLRELLDKDVKRISSKELSEIIGFTASQIRQDLNNFGGFGQQGYGYNVEDLYNEIGKILGLTKNYNTIIVGAGNLGQALANYASFGRFGFNLVGIFDINPKLIGLKINNVEVRDMDELKAFASETPVDIAYICTSRSGAQDVADALMECKIKAVWNFAPVDLKVDDDVIVENVHLIDNLLTLTYFVKEQ
ncbi:redox-sensing transcriptional repressor Rex [Acidaminobacter hydrogenoformans]|uniref:Redox-sensing transcriptional repressor Rex n=1 Tax=Acidaminobacter hydrogenoformans DSM 2784 TaxID=1120920 RepID=A0A1G5S2L6_9FIRM|nr:redox-sensing transcriptional repressor Rex [Acidaminobacter hydrogenoformans]SCZ80536.1 redox-sensing transcriptional repressor [Acidaminobacter hydrogenoformans DSM 2784]